MVDIYCSWFNRCTDVHASARGHPAVRLPDGATVEQHARAGLPDAEAGEWAASLAAALGVQTTGRALLRDAGKGSFTLIENNFFKV